MKKETPLFRSIISVVILVHATIVFLGGWLCAQSLYGNNILNTLIPASFTVQVDSSNSDSLVSLSEIYLGRLAENAKSGRQITGIVGLGIGSFIAVLGGALASETDVKDAGTVGAILLIGGLVVDGVSIWQLSTQSRPEREYDNIKKISDMNKKEHVGHEALISIASDARHSRILDGTICIGLAALSFIARPIKTSEVEYYRGWPTIKEKDSPANDVFGVLYVLTGFYCIIFESAAESALHRYEAEKKSSSPLSLQCGTDFCKKISLNLRYSF
jgi:hypothetical protein